MSEKQIAFLDELGQLFEKYNIDQMCVNSDNTVDFISNGHSIRTCGFIDGVFEYVRGVVGDYKPKLEVANK